MKPTKKYPAKKPAMKKDWRRMRGIHRPGHTCPGCRLPLPLQILAAAAKMVDDVLAWGRENSRL